VTAAWRPVIVAAALVTTLVPTAAGQSRTRVAGAVLGNVANGLVPVANSRVVLHRVGRATQGPIDTVITGADGRFRFEFRADTSASYLVSARFAGIEYFSDPVATNPARLDTAVRVIVSDTSSSAPVRVRTRTFVVSAPDAIGARTVIDWLVLQNPGPATRVAVDTLSPTWGAELPVGARNPQVGDPRLSQFSPEAVEFRADSVYVSAPISPGDKELLLQYELPAEQNRLRVSLAEADSIEAFLEETGISPPPNGWAVNDSQAFEGRRFRRLSRVDHSITRLDLRFPGLGLKPERVLGWLVGGFALVMVIASWRLLRAGPRAGSAGRDLSPVALADEIARLDRDAEGAGPPAAPGRRDQLVAQLEAALARRRRES